MEYLAEGGAKVHVNYIYWLAGKFMLNKKEVITFL